ncbi:hypothetical protein PT015_23215 [Candidatus Mycobacterium wuenschmannii]|uniref:Uncharacterized protein n=1 Tax=Candidatus Mycobacterium wuenschmannii TaxID=3027808 RepID=A0ABY8VY32_9MYCO|nr:hypothetical protein [Candidatus Mycobacterium wuenschmannii]WIM87704.1 hypothetical protein PT015_23215 [Candidatus Mycobacterium wuenschmannii]
MKPVLAGLGAVLTSTASIFAAIAAWLSWQTAQASERTAEESARIAKQQADLSVDMARKSGVFMKIDSEIALRGRCEEGHDTLTAIAGVWNEGLVAGRLNKVIIGVDVPQNLQSKLGDHPADPTMAPIGGWKEDLVLPPQDSAEIEMPLGCPELRELGIDTTRAPEQIKESIAKKALHWKLWPWWAFNPTRMSPVIDIEAAHIVPEPHR